jgi:hypothetical protein
MGCYTKYMPNIPTIEAHREVRIPHHAVPGGTKEEQIGAWFEHELIGAHLDREKIHHVTSTNLTPNTAYEDYRLPELAGIALATVPDRKVPNLTGWGRALSAVQGYPRPQVEIGLPPGQGALGRPEALEQEVAKLRERIITRNRGKFSPLLAYPNYTQTVELAGEPGQPADELRRVAQEIMGRAFFETIVYKTVAGNTVARATAIGPDSATVLEPILTAVEENPEANLRIHRPIRLIGVFEAPDLSPAPSLESFEDMLERVDFKGHQNPYVGKRTTGSRHHDTYRRRWS